MANIYVEQFKNIVKDYLTKAKATQKQIADYKKQFSVAYAEKAIKKVEEKGKQDYLNAKNSIINIFEELRTNLAIANFPNVESLTDDRILFANDTAIKLTANEVMAYVEYYKDNYTMLRLIKDWLEQNKGEGVNDFSSIRIVLPTEQLNVYQQFAQSALSLVDTIYKAGVDTINTLSVDSYADEKFGKQLYDIIGNGKELSEYRTKQMPNSIKHSFDNITLSFDNNLQVQNAPTGFQYKPINRN